MLPKTLLVLFAALATAVTAAPVAEPESCRWCSSEHQCKYGGIPCCLGSCTAFFPRDAIPEPAPAPLPEPEPEPEAEAETEAEENVPCQNPGSRICDKRDE